LVETIYFSARLCVFVAMNYSG